MVFQRRRMVAPIVTRKHYSQNSLFVVAAGVVLPVNFVTVVDRTLANLAFEVAEGSLVKAVYLEYWFTSDDAAQGTFNITVEKAPSASPVMTFANSQDLDSYANKKNILYTTQGLVGPNVQVPLPLIRQWIKIPKGKQRMGLGDIVRINIAAISNGMNGCGFVTYKEYL